MTQAGTAAPQEPARPAAARALLGSTPVFDGHNDLPWALRQPAHADPGLVDTAAPAPYTLTAPPPLGACGGLADFGRQVVTEVQRIGMLVDLSHVSAGTMSDALDVATAPVIFSHSSALALTDHPRNVPDTILERLARNGGVAMVTFVPAFVSTACRDWERGAAAEAERRGIDYRNIESRAELDDWVRANPMPTATITHVAH